MAEMRIRGNLAADPKLVKSPTGEYLYLTVIEDLVNPATGKKIGIDVFNTRVYSDGNPGKVFQLAGMLRKGAAVDMKGRYHRRPSKDADGNNDGYFEYLSIVSLNAVMKSSTMAPAEVKVG